jgi:hypothetical protein
MAWQRLNNVKARVKELEDSQNKYAKKQNIGGVPVPVQQPQHSANLPQ